MLNSLCTIRNICLFFFYSVPNWHNIWHLMWHKLNYWFFFPFFFLFFIFYLPSPSPSPIFFFGSLPFFRASKLPKVQFLGLSLLPNPTDTLPTRFLSGNLFLPPSVTCSSSSAHRGGGGGIKSTVAIPFSLSLVGPFSQFMHAFAELKTLQISWRRHDLGRICKFDKKNTSRLSQGGEDVNSSATV